MIKEELIPVICEKCKKPIKDKYTNEDMRLSKFWYNTDRPKYCSECFRIVNIKQGKYQFKTYLKKLTKNKSSCPKEFNGLHQTKHIFLQVEWYNKLKKDYKCVFVRMEYYFKFNDKYEVKFDVYGEDSENNIYGIEIGNININNKSKLGDLLNYEKNNPKFYFKHININSKEIIHNEKNGLYYRNNSNKDNSE